MYRVFENGKRCREYKIPTWEKDTFESFRMAEKFAIHWALPIGSIEAENLVGVYGFEVDKPVILNSVEMMIKEIEP